MGANHTVGHLRRHAYWCCVSFAAWLGRGLVAVGSCVVGFVAARLCVRVIHLQRFCAAAAVSAGIRLQRCNSIRRPVLQQQGLAFAVPGAPTGLTVSQPTCDPRVALCSCGVFVCCLLLMLWLGLHATPRWELRFLSSPNSFALAFPEGQSTCSCSVGSGLCIQTSTKTANFCVCFVSAIHERGYEGCTGQLCDCHTVLQKDALCLGLLLLRIKFP